MLGSVSPHTYLFRLLLISKYRYVRELIYLELKDFESQQCEKNFNVHKIKNRELAMLCYAYSCEFNKQKIFKKASVF